MKSCILASGSKGNCLYIASQSTKLLVDCGLSLSDIVSRLNQIGVVPNEINGILITHEHSDHCKGVGMLANKYNIPVYFYFDNFEKLNNACKNVKENLQRFFYLQNFYVGDIKVTPFELPHDSNKNLGYSFEHNNKKISIATDLGFVSIDTFNHLKYSTICYLESNHDEEKLMKNDKYTAVLKRRILSQVGHLSNKDCAKTIVNLALTGTRQVVLCHLSEENNTPMLAYSTVKQVLLENDIIEGTHIAVDVAMQHTVGTLFTLD